MTTTDLSVLPMRAVGLGWRHASTIRLGDQSSDLWFHAASATQVLSSVEMAQQPRSGTVGPQWHVSVVDRAQREPARASADQIALARCAFGVLGAEEDNHHPGAARHFWLPVDPTERVDCECKAEEVTVEEPDGYRWTNSADGPCRGCELDRMMRVAGRPLWPCPIHSEARVMRTSGGGEKGATDR